jgi:aryl-phospho-beta-D-glucosidase BglC (GH1 family)
MRVLLLFLCAFAFAGPVSYHGKFEARGPLFYGSKTNKAVQVKGVSFFWSDWAGSFYNKNAVDRLAQDWKAEVVRAAYGSSNPAVYSFSSSAAAANRVRIETIIDAAVENDIYVIIDWHSHDAHLNAENAKQFFSYFAEKYGHLDNVIFELYNEPISATWAQIKGYAEQVIPVIRAHSSNLILVGTRNYSQKVEEVIGNAIEDLNVGYVLHFYAREHLLANFRTAIASTQSNRLPIFVTEFGTTTADGGCSPLISSCCTKGDPIDGDEHNCTEGGVRMYNYDTHDAARTNEWLNALNDRGISYCAWSVYDKYEGSAFFGTKPIPSPSFEQANPENWTNTSNMTASGAYIFNMLRTNYETAAWNPTPVLNGGKTISNSLQAIGGRAYVSLEKGGSVRLNIYSLKGELVKTLFNGNLNAGSHQFSFDLPKGVFILQLSQKNEQNRLFIIKK